MGEECRFKLGGLEHFGNIRFRHFFETLFRRISFRKREA